MRAAGAPLTSGGKPEIFYVGAEYCPYCATERWPLAVALSRFGTCSSLHGIYSSGTDVYPGQPTLTFFGSSFASRYLVFTPVETTTENPDIPLQSPTAAQQVLRSRYDAPPYVPAGDAGPIPFIDLGDQLLIHGAQYDPQVLLVHCRIQLCRIRLRSSEGFRQVAVPWSSGYCAMPGELGCRTRGWDQGLGSLASG
jgi:hypothetical protein